MLGLGRRSHRRLIPCQGHPISLTWASHIATNVLDLSWEMPPCLRCYVVVPWDLGGFPRRPVYKPNMAARWLDNYVSILEDWVAILSECLVCAQWVHVNYLIITCIQAVNLLHFMNKIVFACVAVFVVDFVNILLSIHPIFVNILHIVHASCCCKRIIIKPDYNVHHRV